MFLFAMGLRAVWTSAKGAPPGPILAGRDAPRRWPSTASKALRTSLLAALVAFAGVLIATVGYVERTYGSHRSAIRERPARVALLDLATNRELRGADIAGLARWNGVALELGLELEHLVVSTLSEVDAHRYAALLLPDQEHLAREDWAQLLTLVRSGPGLVVTGHPDLRDPDGRASEEIALEKVLPGESFRLVPSSGNALRVGTRGPLVCGFEPGAIIPVREAAPELVHLGGDSLRFEGRSSRASSAALHATVEEVPVAWLALGADRFERDDDAQRLLGNLLRWATREPLVELRAWPHALDAAALVGAREADLELLKRAELAAPARPFELDLSLDADLLLGRLLARFSEVEREGGLFAAVHEDLARDDRAQIERNLVGELSGGRVFVNGAAELADWWRARAALALELERWRPGRARVELHNRGPAAVTGATVRVHLPPGARPPAEVDVAGPGGPPELRVAASRRWVDLIAPRLDPGATTSYAFVY